MDPNIGSGRCLRVKSPKLYDDPNLDDEIEGKITFSVQEKLKDQRFDISLYPDALLELEGKDFDLKYIQEHGFNTPVLFKNKEGLGLKMPDPVLFGVNDVKSYVGSRRIIDVFDCGTHQPEKMTVHQFVKYYTSKEKSEILNVTSLEFSHTGLDRIVDGPTIVRDCLDWVPLVWPKELYDEQKDQTNSIENMKYPKVRKYVLMSVRGCYTDFHVDFGGTSVWYHVLKGSKVFWLIPPSNKNLEMFEQWNLSPNQKDEFFGDLVDQCYRIHLVTGDTFFIPTGWIHSVYTPEDSLVFGGNYLHSFNIPMQLRVFDIEEATHVPKHLRFPFFVEIHWYMIKSYVEVLERDLDERRKLEFEGDADTSEQDGVFKLLNEELKKDDVTSGGVVKLKWQCIYLTVYELEGLKLLCERLRSWSHAKSNYPKSLPEDSMELLDRLEELLQYHEDDDQILACRGVNIFEQFLQEKQAASKALNGHSPTEVNKFKTEETSSPSTASNVIASEATNSTPLTFNVLERPKRPKKPKKMFGDDDDEPTPTPKNEKRKQKENDDSAKNEKRKNKENEGKQRDTPLSKKEKRRDKFLKKGKRVIKRVRCNQCDGCERENCNECRYCLDMVKNGGSGRLRQSCALRFCKNPQLPGYVKCMKCNGRREKEIIMECNICGETLHPSCSEKKAPCKISKKINNSWECPKCCESDDEATEFSMDQVGNVISSYKQKMREALERELNGGSIKRLGSLKGKIKPKILNKLKLKGKRKMDGGETETENSQEESDDEPLIKKKKTKKNQENGHILKPPPPPLIIVQPVTVVRPGPIDYPYVFVQKDDLENHPLAREQWVHIFTFLNKKEISQCMLVCKAWNQWSLDNRLWKELCINNRPLKQTIMKGIIRRQPSRLSLCSTSINGNQLEWLLHRLPRLKGLDLSLNTASGVSGLLRVACPPLLYLNLSWCDAIFDLFMTQLLSPMRTGKTELIGLSRLQFVENLNLTGCDIGSQTLEAIFLYLKFLRHLDISHCSRVKNSDFELVKSGANINRETLKRIICIGCQLISEQLVIHFMSAENLPALVIRK